MKTSEKTDVIDAAMATVQAEIEQVTKDKTVEVKGREGQQGWSSGYATLPTLYAAVRPALTKHGIALYWGGDFVQGLGAVVVTRLAKGGQYVQSFYPVKTSREGAQGFGGGVSFAKRWGLCGMLGLVPNDAEEGQGYKDMRAETRQPRRQPPPQGIADVLNTIRTVDTWDGFESAARAARARFPTGEGAVAVEKAISARIVAAFDAARTLEGYDDVKLVVSRLQPQGPEIRPAMARAGERLEPRP